MLWDCSTRMRCSGPQLQIIASKPLCMTDAPQELTNMTDNGANDLYASGLQIDDILAIQSIYNANYDTRHTDTIYGLNHGFGTTTDATKEFHLHHLGWRWHQPHRCEHLHRLFHYRFERRAFLLDRLQRFRLRYGGQQCRDCLHDTVIQNAIASFGATTIIGNQWNNVLVGQEGNDLLYSDGNVYTGSQGSGQGADSVGNAIAGGFYQWSSDTYYNAPPTTQHDVLIGYQGDDTLSSGKGDNVLDGGYYQERT